MLKVIIIKTQRLFIKNYTYLVYDDKTLETVAIDPAWDMQRYIDEIEKHDLKVKGVLITHHHMDHTNLAGDIAKKYNCTVYMPQAEVEYYNFSCKNLEIIPNGTDTIFIGEIKVSVITTPGHTYGGACYLIANFLFTGDTLFMEGCGMCNIPGGDPHRMYHSLQKLKKMVHNEVIVYPGHQYHYKIGKSFAAVKSSNVYLNFKNEDEFVKFRSRKGQKGLLDFT